MILNTPPIDPVSTVNDFQSSYVNISTLLAQGGVPPGVNLTSPQNQPILNLDLPAPLRDAFTTFQNSNPVGSLTAVKYMRTTNGNPDLVVDDGTPLPDQNSLVTFSHSVSTIWINSVNIVTHQIIAALTPIPGIGAE